MFNPEDFLLFAKNLIGQASDEKTARTCIGRTYYAAHLTAREKIRRYFPTELQKLERKGDEHKFVRDRLIDRNHADISNKLIGLARKRNRADYNLANYQSLAEQQKEVTNAIQLCENIIFLLKSV